MNYVYRSHRSHRQYYPAGHAVHSRIPWDEQFVPFIYYRCYLSHLARIIQLLGLIPQLEPTARDSAVTSRRSLRRTAECTKLENLRLHFRNLNLSEDSDIFCPVSPVTLDHTQLPTDILWVLPAITPPDILADQISVMSDHLDLTAPDFPGGFIHSTPRRPETPPSPLTPVTSSDSSSPTPSFSRLFDTSESIPRLPAPSATLL
ncbi:hypothetical protein M404DRAFT_18810 [Pisolithus tinctorius Marx 270]|uniref:Uncharacterized protein n=1 Tax=Pisolithus tinctorius Marx 270 TaxID=870435 RepID=A0A0C3PVN4_PISTI|nr:hypothetical protein M404DRAFT_18810 [Pisolithus tinctorius Marx 270]